MLLLPAVAQAALGLATATKSLPRPYSGAAAFRHSFAARTRSLMGYPSLQQCEFMRDAIPADLAQISGRETVATPQSSPNMRWRNLVSASDIGSFRLARTSGGVTRNFTLFVKSRRVNVAEKSYY